MEKSLCAELSVFVQRDFFVEINISKGNKSMKQNVCIIMTDKCNAECKTCCFSCSPKNSAVIDEKLMLKAIDDAAELGSIETIGFSGGEPFLYYELMKKGMEYAKQRGFGVTVATNGFWGGWDDEEMAKKLSALPLDHISFSYDYYHAEYVAENAFERAVGYCKANNISYSVGIGETKEKKANDFFRELGTEKYLMEFYIYPYLRVGRAEKKMPEDVFYKFCDTQQMHCRSEGFFAVRYDGEVFPCCVQTVFDTALSMGNISKSSLKKIMEDGRLAKLVKMIRDPASFTELKNIAASKIKFPDMCGDHCEICRMMFKDERKRDFLAGYADNMYEKKLVDSFLGRGGLK